MRKAGIPTIAWLCSTAGFAHLAWAPPLGAQLDDTWTVTVNGQSVAVNPDGSFLIPNVAAPDLFGEDGPGSRPDFLSDDFLQLTGISTAGGRTRYLIPELFQVTSGETFIFGALVTVDTPPPVLESLRLEIADLVLTPGETTQIEATGTLRDGTQRDVTSRREWTVYRTSNPLIATVDAEGEVTARRAGIAILTAVNGGVTAVTHVEVVIQVVNTTVEGFAQLRDGAPAAGAEVSCPFGNTTADAEGFFSLQLELPPGRGLLDVLASLPSAGGMLSGSKQALPVVPGGLTDAGIIVLSLPANGPLFSLPEYPRGVSPTYSNSARAGDLDGDGTQDLVIATGVSGENLGYISVLRNPEGNALLVHSSYPGGGNPRSAELGDLDGDGDLDVAVVNDFEDTVSVLRNQGAGVFGAPGAFATGDSPWALVLKDFDGDSDLDIATVNRLANGVTVHFNDGNGSFIRGGDHRVSGTSPHFLAAGDLDGDGDADLAVSNFGQGFGNSAVSVLLNRGDGTFPPDRTYGVNEIPQTIALGDLDGDGDLEILVANSKDLNAGQVSILFNRGDGTFEGQVPHETGRFPNSIVVSDLDRDGDLDFAAVHSVDILAEVYSNLSVFYNNGRGAFVKQGLFAGLMYGSVLEAADFSGDGFPDLGVPAGILLNHGDGTFGDERYFAGQRPLEVVAGDLDGDGDVDLAASSWFGNDARLFLNGGAGRFSPGAVLPTGSSPQSLAAGDVDRDGDVDLVAPFIEFPGAGVTVHLNQGDGTFADPSSYRIDRGNITEVALGDIDGDLFPDLAVAGSGLWTLRNRTDGTFDTPRPAGAGGSGLALESLSGTIGFADVVIALPFSGVIVLRNNGVGGFLPPVTYRWGVPGGALDVAVGDLNGDGAADLVATNTPDSVTGILTVSVLLNRGDHTFLPRRPLGLDGDNPQQVAIGDLDGDGHSDLAATSTSAGKSHVVLLLSDGQGDWKSIQAYGVGGRPTGITLADLDQDGDLDIAITEDAEDRVAVLLNRRIR